MWSPRASTSPRSRARRIEGVNAALPSSPETTGEQHTKPAQLRADRMEASRPLNGDEWGPAQASREKALKEAAREEG
ncbi:hypothetical protein [Streptosporangium jomthongense]|uniref:Uncharacterized protein n=1 Tax=Streptosporangium jomthongense TaxID=1193683 RepID=A0ABV8F3H1_9ACTN